MIAAGETFCEGQKVPFSADKNFKNIENVIRFEPYVSSRSNLP